MNICCENKTRSVWFDLNITIIYEKVMWKLKSVFTVVKKAEFLN